MDVDTGGELVISRIFVFLLAVVLACMGVVLITKNRFIYRVMGKLYDRFSGMNYFNALSRLDLSGVSRVTSVFMGIIAFLMALLLFVVVIFGKDQ